MRPHSLFALLLAGLSLVSVHAQAQHKLGPIQIDSSWRHSSSSGYGGVPLPQQLSVFVELEAGEELAVVSVEVHRPWAEEQTIMRVYDEQEQLLFWRLADDAAQSDYPTEELADPSLDSNSGRELLRETFIAPAKGIYNVRVSASSAAVTFEWPEGADFAVHAGNTSVNGWDGMPSELYLWAPAHRTVPLRWEFESRSGDIDLRRHHDDTLIASLRSVDQSPTDRITYAQDWHSARLAPKPEGDGELWRMEPLGERWALAASGPPLILATSASLAERLHAGLERITTGPMRGTLVAHKWQKELAERVMPALEEGIGDADALLALAQEPAPRDRPGCATPASLEEAIRARAWFHSPGRGVAWALSSTDGMPHQEYGQDASHWYGTYGPRVTLTEGRCFEDADCVMGSLCAREEPSDATGYCDAFDIHWDRWDILRSRSFKTIRGDRSNRTTRGIVEWNANIAKSMGWAAINHHPCNPWGPSTPNTEDGQEALVYRAVLASMASLMAITEDDRLFGDDLSTYVHGPTAFRISSANGAYAQLIGHVEGIMTETYDGERTLGRRVAEIWNEALRRVLLDRRYFISPNEAVNQAAHYLAMADLAAYRPAPGEPHLHPALRAFGSKFTKAVRPPGWFSENGGPDATYIGLTHSSLAHYHIGMLKNPDPATNPITEALTDSYEYFNHTVAPEPSGRMAAAFSFNHRTTWGFNSEQGNGARSVVWDIPQVALWVHQKEDYDKLVDVVEDFSSDLAFSSNKMLHMQTTYGGALGRLSTPSALIPQEELTWPAQRLDHEDYFVNFSDDLVAVRKPGLYAMTYVGRPIVTYTNDYPSRADVFLNYVAPHTPPSEPDRWLSDARNFDPSCGDDFKKHYVSYWEDLTEEDVGDGEPFDYPTFKTEFCKQDYLGQAPFTGGGLGMLWTPDFGASVLTTNWSPLTHHGLVAVADDRRTWESYRDAEVVGTPSSDALVTKGLLPRAHVKEGGEGPSLDGLAYERRYAYADNHVDVTVELEAIGRDWSVSRVWENIPLSLCTSHDLNDDGECKLLKGRLTDVHDLSGQAIPVLQDVTLEGFELTSLDEHGETTGMRVVFDEPRQVRFSDKGLRGYGVRIGRVEVNLSTTLAMGQGASLSYTISTLNPIDRPEPPIEDMGVQDMDAQDMNSADMDVAEDMGTPSSGDLGPSPSDMSPSQGMDHASSDPAKESGCGGCSSSSTPSHAPSAMLLWLVGLLALRLRRR